MNVRLFNSTMHSGFTAPHRHGPCYSPITSPFLRPVDISSFFASCTAPKHHMFSLHPVISTVATLGDEAVNVCFKSSPNILLKRSEWKGNKPMSHFTTEREIIGSQ